MSQSQSQLWTYLEEDHQWKCWIIKELLPKTSSGVQQTLLPDIKRLSSLEPEDDEEKDVALAAQEFLDQIK